LDAEGEEETHIAVWPDEAFRNTRPQPGEPPKLVVPSVERFALSNGLEVYFMQEPTLPVARAWLDFDLGSVSDPKGKAGMHSLCADLVDEGSKSLDKTAWKEALDDEALRVWTSAGRDRSTYGVESLASQFPAGLARLRELIDAPGLRQEDFVRLREQRVDSLPQARATHSGVAGRVTASLVYGADHPYGRIADEKSYAKIRVKDCARFVKSLGPKGARIFVAAKLSREALESQLETALGSWKGKAPTPRAMPGAKARTGVAYFVDVPDSVQSSVAVVALGPARKAPDYAATAMMMRILGGSFSSRINMNLREDKGYAYGGRGYFSYAKKGSYLSTGARVRRDATVDSVSELLVEIAGVREGPLREDELHRERAGAIAALPASFGSSATTLRTLRTLIYHDLPLDWHLGYEQELAKLDLAAVEEAGRAHLPTDDHFVLVVGDGKVVRADLQAFAQERGMSFVELDADGRSKP
jgi:zinc protease